MKKQVLILIAIFIGMATSNATVYTVSNDPNNPAQYENYADAHVAASPGDTIYIYGSPIDYGNLEIYKPLTIIGAGYNPENQYQYPTTFTKIYLNDEGSSSASGTTLIGIKSSGGLNNQNMIDNISIFYCDLSIYVGVKEGIYPTPMEANNWIIRNNILRSIDAGVYAKNFIISNNIIPKSIDSFQDPSIIISNNLFMNSYFGTALQYMRFSTFINNIFYGTSVSREYCLAEFCTFNNNLSYLGDFTEFIPGECNNTGNNNLENIDPQFNSVASTTFSFDYDYRLQDSSPCKNAGIDGTDIGITGGAYPWPQKADGTLNLTGMPPIPQIIEMYVLNPVVPANGTLSVKVKAHN